MTIYRDAVKSKVIALAGFVALLVAGCGASASSDVVQGSEKGIRSGLVDAADHPEAITPPGDDNGLPPILHKIDTQDRVVFLTIDDGYAADPKIAEILKLNNIPVTPFLTRDAVQNTHSTDYYNGIEDQTGQSVQNHTLSHPELPGVSDAERRRQICETNDVYTKWFGQTPWMLRPPYGAVNDKVQQAAKDCGIDYVVLWSVSLPGKHLRYGPGKTLEPGDIILTHWRDDLYKDLPGALKDIQKQGFKIAALQDYLPNK